MSRCPVFSEIIIMPEKFWLHRVNDSNNIALDELMKTYRGIELDVIYFEMEDDFDVNHNSKGYIENSLRKYLPILKEKEHKIWLDFKNLNGENCQKALKCLNGILVENEIGKGRIILESPNDVLLAYFKKNDYYTSCYVPYLKLDEMSEEEKTSYQEYLKGVAATGNINAFSFPAYLYDFMKSAEILNLDFLTWDSGGGTGRDFWNYTYFDRNAREIIRDPQVKVILVGDRRKRMK